MYELTLTLLYLSAANAQYPIMDAIAKNIIQKYQTSSCEQLYQQKAEKQQPSSEDEQKATGLLRGDPQMRQAFICKIAAPIANKLFDCGLFHDRTLRTLFRSAWKESL